MSARLAASVRDQDTFAWLVGVLLPHGGYVVLQVEADFDESGSHDGAPVLCVGGYIIKKHQAIELGREWRRVLRSKDLPYFRMSECAHGNGPFANLSKAERLEVETKMIGIIKRRTIKGIAVTVNSDEFTRLMPSHSLIGTPYTFCAHVILGGVAVWLKGNLNVGQVAYFFEAGHRSEHETDRIMKALFLDEKARKAHRYKAHSFMPKEESCPLQAADLLAWQWYTDKRHKMENRPRRKDCLSLLEHPHDTVHIGQKRIAELAERFGSEIPNEQTLMRLHFGDPETDEDERG